MTSPARYGTFAQALHWLTVVLVLVAFVYGPGGSEERVYSVAADARRQLHETLGLCVFALAVLRLAWRLVDTHPDPPEVSRWLGIAAKSVQWLLYVLVFAVPLAAIAGAWLEGHPLTLFGGVQLGPLTGPSHAAGARIAKLHGWLGDALLWLAGLHAVAALYHHLVLQDGVLVSMLPAWFPIHSKERT